MQTAIEAEVTEFLGRERYAHGERAREGSRNGHCPTTIKTTTGPVTIERPKLRGTDEAFASRLLGVGVCRTNALESPGHRRLRAWPVGARRGGHPGRGAGRRGGAVEVDGEPGVRGDQGRVRHLEAAGPGRRPPRVPVPRRQPLQDARRGPGRAGAGRVGHDDRGPARAGGLGAGRLGVHRRLGRVPRRAWSARGLRAPLLVVSDGAPGLLAAVELVFAAQPAPALSDPPGAKRAGQGARRAPGRGQGRFLERSSTTSTHRPGERAIAVARGRADEFAKTYAKRFPAAVECLMTNFESLTTYLRFPAGHRVAYPALQLHRAHLRRDPPAGQGHRAPPRRAQLPRTGVGRPRIVPAAAGAASS